MKQFPTREQVAQLREQYPSGTRICVDRMENDPHPIPPGTMGTVIAVDDAGHLHCRFDNGRQLGLIWSVDAFHVVQSNSKQLLEEKINSCYDAYQAEWLTKSPEELIQMADTICAVNLTKELLVQSVSPEEAEYLLKFRNPLEDVSDCWKIPHLEHPPFIQKELKNAVEQLMDTCNPEQDDDQKQPEEIDCSEEPGMSM